MVPPHGGQWSFDADNRKKLPNGITVPLEPASPQQIDVASMLKQLKHEQLPLLGNGDQFNYPVNHQQAALWLDQFLDDRFKDFGAYEDAISSTPPSDVAWSFNTHAEYWLIDAASDPRPHLGAL